MKIMRITNQTENNFESSQGKLSPEPNTNPAENTQQNILQIPESSFFEIFSGQIKNPALELQQQFSEVLSPGKIYAGNEHLRLQHQQRRIEAVSKLLRKQKIERNLLIQQLNQNDTGTQNDIIALENSKMIRSINFKKSTATTSCNI